MNARWLAFLSVLAAPALALACPSCAGRNDGGMTQVYLLGSMILFPFGVAYAVLRVLRRVQSAETAETLAEAPLP